MSEKVQIKSVTTEKINRMKGKSVLALSDSPSADGVSAAMIKQVFVSPLWEGDDSLVGEINRICLEINTIVDSIMESVSSTEKKVDEVSKKVTDKKLLPTYSYDAETGRLTITIGE